MNFSCLELLEHSWTLYMDHLMVMMMASLSYYGLEVHWDLLMVKCLALMKA